jgi:hypothetical protein
MLALAATLFKLNSGTDDTDIYFRYANLACEGKIPYRDYRVEYPPLALPLFLVPRFAARNVTGFKIAFGALMLVFNALTVWLVAARVERMHGLARVRTRLAWYTVFFAVLSRLVVSRYDAAAMLLGFGASYWWFSGRVALGGAAAALGTFMKIYPAALVVPAAAWELRKRGQEPFLIRGRTPFLTAPYLYAFRGTLTFVLASLLAAAAWLALGGIRGVSESLRYQLERGFEYGSLYSGVQMLAAKALGAPIVIARDHAAWSSITPWSAPLSVLVFPIQAAAMLIVWVTYVRRGMAEGFRYSGAAVLALVLTGKVFSPQYLLWLVPYIAVLDGPVARRGSWIFAAGCAAALLAPAAAGFLPRTSAWVILAFNLKNVLFLWLLAVLTFGEPGDQASRGDRKAR